MRKHVVASARDRPILGEAQAARDAPRGDPHANAQRRCGPLSLLHLTAPRTLALVSYPRPFPAPHTEFDASFLTLSFISAHCSCTVMRRPGRASRSLRRPTAALHACVPVTPTWAHGRPISMLDTQHRAQPAVLCPYSSSHFD
jgi:hypothetical protein